MTTDELTLLLIIGLILFAGAAAWCRTMAEREGYYDPAEYHDAEHEAARHNRTEKHR